MNIAMKYTLLTLILIGAGGLHAQGLLNKIKSKASQEINKEVSKSENANSSSAAHKNKLSANVTRSILTTLGGDETFDYSENCIDLGTAVNQVSFVITKRVGSTSQCIAFKNGTRTKVDCPSERSECPSGPQCSYSQLIELNLESDEAKKYVSSQTNTKTMPTPGISDDQLKMMSAYMTKEQLETVKKQMAEAAKQTQGKTYTEVASMSINFNGKTFGPYKQIMQFFLTQDRKNFFAVLMEQGGTELRYKVITSASSKILTTPSMMPPRMILAAPDYSEFAMFVGDVTGKLILVTSTDKTSPIGMGNLMGAWYSTSGNHIIYILDNQLYYDMQSIQTLESGTDACSLFVTSDGKGVSTIKNNKLSFADGDYYEFPLKTQLVNSGGKVYFKWLALEDRELVVYQKPY
jgi:hypothetical protein